MAWLPIYSKAWPNKWLMPCSGSAMYGGWRTHPKSGAQSSLFPCWRNDGLHPSPEEKQTLQVFLGLVWSLKTQRHPTEAMLQDLKVHLATWREQYPRSLLDTPKWEKGFNFGYFIDLHTFCKLDWGAYGVQILSFMLPVYWNKRGWNHLHHARVMQPQHQPQCKFCCSKLLFAEQVKKLLDCHIQSVN